MRWLSQTLHMSPLVILKRPHRHRVTVQLLLCQSKLMLVMHSQSQADA